MSHSRQFTLLYNSSALDTPLSGGADPGLLFEPLLYDAEVTLDSQVWVQLAYCTQTLLQIASVFGAVDYFGPYVGNEGDQVSANFPPPHNAPRSPGQDPGCWKVKWAHRDDCVSALLVCWLMCATSANIDLLRPTVADTSQSSSFNCHVGPSVEYNPRTWIL